MKISALPLEALLFKLRTNFQENLDAVAIPTYGVKPYTIDFPQTIYDGNTKSFFMGKIHPEDVIAAGVSKQIKFTMYVDSSVNQNYEKPRDFSGIIPVTIDCHLGWLSSDMRQNLEILSLATEDAMAETIQPYNQQNWGAGVVYNGQFSAPRSFIEAVGEKGQGGLYQLLSFKLGFQVDV